MSENPKRKSGLMNAYFRIGVLQSRKKKNEQRTKLDGENT